MNLCLSDGVVSIDWSRGENELNSAILLSIFCEKGYWGDLLEPNKKNIGSLIWTLRREPRNKETLNKLKRYVEEALSWMMTEGQVERIKVDASIEEKDIKLVVLIDEKLRVFSL